VRRLFHRERRRRIALAAAILFLLTWEVGPFARLVSAAGRIDAERRERFRTQTPNAALRALIDLRQQEDPDWYGLNAAASGGMASASGFQHPTSNLQVGSTAEAQRDSEGIDSTAGLRSRTSNLQPPASSLRFPASDLRNGSIAEAQRGRSTKAARSPRSVAGQEQQSADDVRPKGRGYRPPASDLQSPASNIDQGRIVDYRLDTRGAPHEVFFNRAPSGRFDGGGNLVKYARTLYVQDLGTGNKSHGYLAQIKNSWHYKQFGFWISSTLVQNDYTYSLTGNRLTNTVSDNAGPIRTEQYGYDELSRLTSVNYGDGQTQTYTFDPMGNRLTKTDNVAGNDTYTYNAANMLLTRNGGAYTNDANGNTLTGGNRTNTWDGQNRLTTCVFNGTTTNHTYGSDGLRRRTVQGSNTTDYVLDGQGAVRTLLNGALDRTYLHGARGPEYERIGSNSPLWYLYDGLGSVVGTIDGNGVIQQTRKYDVYGAVRSSTGGSGTKHKFVGNLGHPSEDATGLIYMRARYMDPVTGRFTSEDPARHGTNWYIYAVDNPTVRVDNSGRSPDDSFDPVYNFDWKHWWEVWTITYWEEIASMSIGITAEIFHDPVLKTFHYLLMAADAYEIAKLGTEVLELINMRHLAWYLELASDL
jgi:RHS repeat-associated protein